MRTKPCEEHRVPSPPLYVAELRPAEPSVKSDSADVASDSGRPLATYTTTATSHQHGLALESLPRTVCSLTRRRHGAGVSIPSRKERKGEHQTPASQ